MSFSVTLHQPLLGGVCRTASIAVSGEDLWKTACAPKITGGMTLKPERRACLLMELYRETYPKFSRPGTWVHGKQWAVTEDEEGRHHLTILPNNRVASVLGDELCRNCAGIVHRLDPWCRSLGFTGFHAATAVYLSISRAMPYRHGSAPTMCVPIRVSPTRCYDFSVWWPQPGGPGRT